MLASYATNKLFSLFILIFGSKLGFSAESDCLCGKSASTKSIKQPWFAEVYYKKDLDYIYTCNGVLVSPWIVLTSEYCARKGKP